MRLLNPTGTAEVSKQSQQLLTPGGATIGIMAGVYQEVGCWERISIDRQKPTWIDRWVFYDVEEP